MSDVTTQHPLYEKRKLQWAYMRDVIEGSDVIKDKGEQYLPAPSTENNCFSLYEAKRYKAFKERATFVNFTAQIKDVLHGICENKPAAMVIPVDFRKKGIIDNVNYKGDSMDQFVSDCLSDVLETGFGGVLVDYPVVDRNISIGEAEKNDIRPYLNYYRAEDIINWKYRIVNGIKKLCLVVLHETLEKNADTDFSHNYEDIYRVLMLNNKNHYEVSIYKKADNKNNGEYYAVSKQEILIRGDYIDYIPFVRLPFEEPVKPILYDVAKINISHYQMTADYQNAVHLTTRPTAYFTGHEPERDKDGNLLPIYIGADVVWQLPEPDAKVGTCTFAGEGLQHNENALARAEAQIVTLSSHIISNEKKTAENKDVARIHRQGEDAKLATYVRYLSKRFTDILKIMCEWEGVSSDEVSFELNADFSNLAFDANSLNSIANIFSQGKLPLRSLYYLLQQSGYLEPDMDYQSFVYLLDLENASLSPSEVDEAYKKYKKTGNKIELVNADYYSPSSFVDEEDRKKAKKNEDDEEDEENEEESQDKEEK